MRFITKHAASDQVRQPMLTGPETQRNDLFESINGMRIQLRACEEFELASPSTLESWRAILTRAEEAFALLERAILNDT